MYVMRDRKRLDHILAKLSILLESSKIKTPKYKGAILGAAVVFLIVGVVLSIRQQPTIFADLDWRPALIVIAIGIPFTVWFNALEFMLIGRFVGQTIPFIRALEVTIIGTAANLLPLPGSTLVRVASLGAGGVRYRDGTLAVLMVSVTWIGVAFLYAGVAILLVTPNPLGTIFVVAGLGTLSATVVAAMRVAGGLRTQVLVMAAKLILVVTDAARIFLCLIAIGTAATFTQASALAVSGVVGTAVSIVPAGLGVREAVAAALSPVVGLALASGFLATTLNRILELITIVPIASALAIRSRAREG
jgi:hypothetical protein